MIPRVELPRRLISWEPSGRSPGRPEPDSERSAGGTPGTVEVLIVEDDPLLRETLAELLAYEGHTVAQASNGLEALAYLRRHPAPGVILLDLMMPRMNGWVFRSEMLQDPALARIPVLILSAVDEADRDSLSLYARAFLNKPVDLMLLLQAVHDTLQNRP